MMEHGAGGNSYKKGFQNRNVVCPCWIFMDGQEESISPDGMCQQHLSGTGCPESDASGCGSASPSVSQWLHPVWEKKSFAPAAWIMLFFLAAQGHCISMMQWSDPIPSGEPPSRPLSERSTPLSWMVHQCARCIPPLPFAHRWYPNHMPGGRKGISYTMCFIKEDKEINIGPNPSTVFFRLHLVDLKINPWLSVFFMPKRGDI